MTESTKSPSAGGGLPVLKYWVEKSVSPQGVKIWEKLNHQSSCLSCAWGTGGQKGGFVNEEGEYLQRCAKSVEAISAELQEGIKPDFFAQFTIEELQQLDSQQCDQLGRLSYPVILRKDSNHYERITWQEVYDIAEKAFKHPPERVASYSSGRSSNEAAFILQLMMRALGSNNLADCSDLCHAPSTVGLKEVFGSGTSMVSLESLKQSDCVVLIGSNAPANHPRLMNELIKIRDKGGKVIIVNPQIEVGLVKFASPAFPIKSLLKGGSDISTLYVQPIPGSDVAVFVGIQKSLLEQNLINFDYLRNYTDGWQEVVNHAENTSWDTIIDTCGLSREEIEEVAYTIGKSQKVVFAWAMGITHHTNGVDNVKSIANTALITGNAGKMGAGTMPIRGHSNVQGFGSMGVTIRLSELIKQALKEIIGQSVTETKGYSARGLITASDNHKVDTLFCLGGNLYGANPDLTEAKRSLSNIETIFYVATKPNLGHFHGLAKENTLILPVFNRFENPHRTTTESGNNFVRLNEMGTTHLQDGDLVSEIELITEIADKILGENPINWKQLQDTSYIRELIAKTIPGYQKIGEIDKTKEEFTIDDRIFTQPRFKTANGKAQMQVTPLPVLTIPDKEFFEVSADSKGIVLILGTGRGYGQHNTVVYNTADKYRGMLHRYCILMNREDIKKGGFVENQRVKVKGDAGELDNIEIIAGNILQGTAFMFYPEANILFKAHIDNLAETPAYKRVPIFIYS
ncbi:putative formate dehydrogenase oxidoreductase protein [Geminocystis sp. NIES-3708]|uniref:FdhF/YdeP family oxidoreductase n=1 Tax=Geminocystis sp. NIES-3708 TaxID=1615909 RepID=UPI0005FCC4D7|nr:FdhF/YdeP family oxidoreductase [Geminocystis sp. NIES-3708]BAQ62174.1 putative formate dehydrogenase oxidoreductase protein [Geminocystis sp. NIES-3708]